MYLNYKGPAIKSTQWLILKQSFGFGVQKSIYELDMFVVVNNKMIFLQHLNLLQKLGKLTKYSLETLPILTVYVYVLLKF